MSDETIRTLSWAIVAMFGIQGATIYCVVRLALTGRSLFERHEHEGGRVVGRLP